MAFPTTPKIMKGALVQLTRDVIGVTPFVIPFQFNPSQLSVSLTPWNPFEVDAAQRGSQAPTVQPYQPKETFSLTVELDAADGLEDGDPLTQAHGILPRLAALKKLTLPSRGPVGDLVAAAEALSGSAQEAAHRPTVPIVLFVWGPGRILPVRVTSYSAEETAFSAALYPTQASVALTLEVLPPDVFHCQEDPVAKVAVAAFRATALQEAALAVESAADPRSVRSLLPF